MTWLIGARAMQGFGGGSIISLTQIIIGDIVPLHKRGVSGIRQEKVVEWGLTDFWFGIGRRQIRGRDRSGECK
jgi:MFS family permease